MLKYLNTAITFSELPDEITLCINITGCKNNCKGCHSPYLAEDIGKPLTITRIEKLIKDNRGITAICFMGGDNDPKLINHYASLIKKITTTEVVDIFNTIRECKFPKISIPANEEIECRKVIPNNLKVGWYSGKQELAKEIDLKNFDYIKLGPYIEEKGPINSKTTNQIMYKIDNNCGKSIITDITSRFWK